MKTTAAAAVTVGADVVLTAEYVALFERPDLDLVIHEVVDCRGAGKSPIFTIAPVAYVDGRVTVDYAAAREVFADDVRAVQS